MTKVIIFNKQIVFFLLKKLKQTHSYISNFLWSFPTYVLQILPNLTQLVQQVILPFATFRDQVVCSHSVSC